MKATTTIAELRGAFRNVKSGCAGDTIFMAKAMMWMCEQIAQKQPKKRKPSAYQKFLSQEMKKGRPIKEIAADWRERKAKA